MYKYWIVLAVCAASALGQTTAGQKGAFIKAGDVAEFGPIGITTALAGPMAAIPNAPYSATSTTERVQVLADGNRIVQSASGSVARDSQGRVRREESLPGFKSSGGEAPHLVMIDDPVAQVHWTLDTQRKTAMKMPVPNVKAGPFAIAGSGAPAANMFYLATSAGPITNVAVSPEVSLKGSGSPTGDTNLAKTDLGTQVMEGVPAQGTRMVKTIPAGQVGNEQPIVITTETWYSPDLKVLVMSRSSDPRMGDTTYTLTNIQRVEPPPSLFQVPDDYTIKEGPAPTLQPPRNQ